MNFLTKLTMPSLFAISTMLTNLLGVSFNLSSSYQKNVLLIGRDSAENRSGERADALILCNIKKKEKTITLISIPRDSKVTIPCGPNGNIQDKISHALYYGSKKGGTGETCVTKTVKNMFNISSLPYISINFKGIKDIVNKVGGVEVISPFSFCQEGKDGKRYCFAKNTKTKVSGDAFLAFVRHRKTFIRGDFDRTYNQRIALTSLFNKIKNSSNYQKIKLGIYSLSKVRTNIHVATITTYAKLNLNKFKINSVMLNGTDSNGRVYYYQVDERHLTTLSEIIK